MSYVSIWKNEEGVFETFENPQNGRVYTVKHLKPFREWVEAKYGDYDKFLKLRREDKDVIFLKYKQGLESHSANVGLEISDRANLKTLTSEELAEDGHYHSLRIFEDYCYKVKKEIGLAPSDEETEMEKRVMGVFGK